MPFRHARIPGLSGQVLVTSMVGEYMFLSDENFSRLINHQLDLGSDVFRSLRTRQIVCDVDRGPFFEGLEAQQRTRKLLATEDPTLHIFVVTLRCDHRCTYCQVSPRHPGEAGFDMTQETANAALDRVFESRAPCLTIEFQGGEAGLAFDRVRYVVEQAEDRNRKSGQQIRFVMATTLHLLSDEMLAFCRAHSIELSTSLDGPAVLHDANRINRSRDSFERTITGIQRAKAICGHDRVAALPTITSKSLSFARNIVDTYVDLGFDSISLRPISPFGFARRTMPKLGYDQSAFLHFYREALDYIIELNLRGIAIEESYATLLLTRILTPFPTSYVDLQSPAAAGTAVLVYNYDGGVYVSDEGRMLAETGDSRFRMGSVHDSLEKLRRSEAMQIIREAGEAERLPGCSTCAFVPYCGADPVFHVATQGDPVGDRATSEFCQRHTGLFRLLFEHLARRDPDVMRVFLSWISRRSVSEISHPGYLC
jgi:His-Xaa-Ser system radical SAM maturase HxsB